MDTLNPVAMPPPDLLEDGGRLFPISSLTERYLEVRRFSESLCEPLETEDYVIQSMPDVSPAKWHLAHTSWFFETFLLKPYVTSYDSPFPQYNFLFNSYYNAVGDRHCRAQRGLLSRPTVRDTYAYRRHVDEQMVSLLDSQAEGRRGELESLVTLGLHHEQQHQELMVTDLKHVFSVNPLRPAYLVQEKPTGPAPDALQWVPFGEGVYEIGYAGNGFSFDNETPRHREFLNGFALGSRPVTNGEYLEFMADGGYDRPEVWLSAGWATVQERAWNAPFYWEQCDGNWMSFTLYGMQPIDPAEPVCHVSYFEADAYARWAGTRLPTEAEWEVAAEDLPIRGNFVEEGQFHPVAYAEDGPLRGMYGGVWEWTRSSYAPYPGYEADPGALGEYNGKFMCNQYVLRGGSCATSVTHIRPTYRNFFPTDARWQFSGIRLAKDL